MFLEKNYFPQCKLKVLLLCCHQYAQCDHKFFYLAAFHFIIIGTFLSYSTFANGEVREAIFFRKPTSPPLPLREGPPLISVFSPQGKRGNRSSSSLWTISFYGWRTIRGLRQQRSCSFLCGDEPAFTQGFAKRLLARCFFRKTYKCFLKRSSKTHQYFLEP